ncbi:MAG: hypothetical protein OXG72_12920 [Acidobacteria bacterium]|nr:hypothetical protein [Acidobacteriota bacterium]
MRPTEPAGAALPPGHVTTMRVATPDPRNAKRHILVPSGWRGYHVAACHIDLPTSCCETGAAPAEDVECPRCRQTPEFAQAVEEARSARTNARRRDTAGKPPPETTPAPKRPAAPRATKKRAHTRAAKQAPPSPQGSLF